MGLGPGLRQITPFRRVNYIRHLFRRLDYRQNLLLIALVALLLLVLNQLLMVHLLVPGGRSIPTWITVAMIGVDLVLFLGLYLLFFGPLRGALRDRERLYQAIIDQAPMAVAMFDREMNYLALSDPWLRLFEYEGEADLIGENHFEVMPEVSERADWVEMLDRSLEGEAFRKEEDCFDREGDSLMWVSWALEPWYQQEDRVGGVILYVEDVTDVVQARRELSRSRDELEEEVYRRTRELQEAKRRLEEANQDLESFSYSVSHDLRTPLRAITGFSEILMEDHADQLDQEATRLLNVVVDNTRRMGTLIDDILAYSRVTRSEPVMARVDMAELFRQAYREVSESYPEQARRADLELDELPQARGDQVQLRQVAVNLLSNALKYSSSREHIRIRVGGESKGARVRYSVVDNGIGFDMDYAENLFGVFERLHPSSEFEGTGVGLSIVKRILERHGGDIRAESRPGEGAAFHFELPKPNQSTSDDNG